MHATSLRATNWLLAAAASVVYVALYGEYNLFAVLFLFSFMLWPLVLNSVVAIFPTTWAAQVALLGATIAYAVWAFFLLADVAYFNNSSDDGQAGFSLLLTALVAAPVFLMVWVACLVIEVLARRKAAVHEPSTTVGAGSP